MEEEEEQGEEEKDKQEDKEGENEEEEVKDEDVKKLGGSGGERQDGRPRRLAIGMETSGAKHGACCRRMKGIHHGCCLSFAQTGMRQPNKPKHLQLIELSPAMRAALKLCAARPRNADGSGHTSALLGSD